MGKMDSCGAGFRYLYSLVHCAKKIVQGHTEHFPSSSYVRAEGIGTGAMFGWNAIDGSPTSRRADATKSGLNKVRSVLLA